jgi:hypothetical protein
VLQQQRSRPSPQIPQTDIVDEIFYREIEERVKRADRERRETARRARDNFHRNSMQLNVCFDTDNHTTILLQPPPLNLSNTINRETSKEKKIHIEFIEKNSPISPTPLFNDFKKVSVEQEESPLTIVEKHRS